MEVSLQARLRQTGWKGNQDSTEKLDTKLWVKLIEELKNGEGLKGRVVNVLAKRFFKLPWLIPQAVSTKYLLRSQSIINNCFAIF